MTDSPVDAEAVGVSSAATVEASAEGVTANHTPAALAATAPVAPPAVSPPAAPRPLEPGMRLAGGRFRLEERHQQGDGFQSWRAVDEKLRRSVGVHLLPAEHERAAPVLAAARAAALVTDVRFVQVLDASQEDGVVYVVTEWLSRGGTLADSLRSGPLPPIEATAIAYETADALRVAHDAGLAHLRLTPENVFRTDTGQIKIIGLNVEATLHRVTAPDPELTDARGVARLLFACLTGRWLDGPAFGLPAAQSDSRDHRQFRAPGQVRSGIPAALDDITVRTLSDTSSHGGPPLRTPAALASALAMVPHAKIAVTSEEPAVRTATTVFGPFTAEPVTAAPPPLTSRSGRAVGLSVGAIVLVGLALLAFGIVKGLTAGGGDPQAQASDGHGGGQGVATTPLHVADAQVFAPGSSGGSHQEQVPRTYDGQASTGWSTPTYRGGPAIPPYRPGIGIMYDLGSVQTVRDAKVQLQASGATVQLLAAGSDVTDEPPADPLGTMRSFGQVANSPQALTWRLQSVRTRYLLVWFTAVPYQGASLPYFPDAGYRDAIQEVTFLR